MGKHRKPRGATVTGGARSQPCPCGSGNDAGACSHRGAKAGTTRNGRRSAPEHDATSSRSGLRPMGKPRWA